MLRTFRFLGVALGLAVWPGPRMAALRAQEPYAPTLMAELRAASRMIPGEPPQSLHYLRYAESTFPTSALLEGGSGVSMTASFAVFQIRYRDSWIMVDAGHDKEVDRSFAGQSGHRYRDDRFETVQRALRDASLILVTHEHHDHVAGVVRSAFPDEVVPKTVLTRAQLQALQRRPAIPSIRLTPEASRRYRIIDYELLFPIAPGVVLLQAPGHTAGSQFVYVRLASGREAIFVGDVVYAAAGIGTRRQKPEGMSGELGEDRASLQQQIDWLYDAMTRDGVALIPSHDDSWLAALGRRGVITDGLALTR
ncbi:MAG TPA: MBL fold metallo-hydrolase [Gemmatimonadaceae bacterium]|nr:MBL fold metallo-hydrolase [Gemmatimonadaceae bacterium]